MGGYQLFWLMDLLFKYPMSHVAMRTTSRNCIANRSANALSNMYGTLCRQLDHRWSTWKL